MQIIFKELHLVMLNLMDYVDYIDEKVKYLFDTNKLQSIRRREQITLLLNQNRNLLKFTAQHYSKYKCF
ncbi:unnamed protein product [Paramecium sonneborni]|uniref:Uncharacterized protein n=1 Tax=Paramecium sonneborni TaxID=65129 RepID=A0A8S1RL41_9CILI|nr:unnamed protein product [Paramecium sonneborni]